MTRIILAFLCLLMFGASTADAARGQKRGRWHECPPIHHTLQRALSEAASFGRVTVTSVCTGRHARGSYHYRKSHGWAMAVDFRVRGDWRAVRHHFRNWRGGFAHYCRGRGCGLFHIDVGPRRRWR